MFQRVFANWQPWKISRRCQAHWYPPPKRQTRTDSRFVLIPIATKQRIALNESLQLDAEERRWDAWMKVKYPSFVRLQQEGVLIPEYNVIDI